MSGVSATCLDILAYARRLNNVLNVQLAYDWRITCVLKKSMYRLLFRDLLQFFEDIRRERMEVAFLQYQYDLIDLAVHSIRRRRRRKRLVWVRPWIGRRRQCGLYDQLLVELRNEEQRSFKNFMRMPREMFD